MQNKYQKLLRFWDMKSQNRKKIKTSAKPQNNQGIDISRDKNNVKIVLI